MSFGVYRPQLGVSAGHRELSSNQSLQDNRRYVERVNRQETNPITGEAMTTRTSTPSRRPPSGNLGAGLVPTKGPMDHMTVLNKDVPAKKVDPTRNQSTSFGTAGVSCIPVTNEVAKPPRPMESAIADLLSQRAPTPERRSTPGQVVKGGYRPKDSLAYGCIVADKPATDPMGLPHQAGSGGAGVGSGGSGHLVAGPTGFVPKCSWDEDLPTDATAVPRNTGPTPFRPVWGA